MKLLRALGLGKDPLLEWCVANFKMEVEKEELDRSIVDDGPPRWFWRGRWRERKVFIPTGPTSNKFDFTGTYLNVCVGDEGSVLDLGLYRPNDDDDDEAESIGEFALDPECRRELLVPSVLSGLKGIVPTLSDGVVFVSVARPGFRVSLARGCAVTRIPADLDAVQRILDLVTSAG